MRLVGTFVLFSFASSVSAEMLTVIGTPELVEDRGEGCDVYIKETVNDEGEISFCVSKALHFRYKVSKVIEGTYAEPSINFIGFYHYDGLPDYVQYGNVLLVLEKEQDAYFLKDVTPTFEKDDGSWEVCGEWPEDQGEDCLSWMRVEDFVAE